LETGWLLRDMAHHQLATRFPPGQRPDDDCPVILGPLRDIIRHDRVRPPGQRAENDGHVILGRIKVPSSPRLLPYGAVDLVTGHGMPPSSHA
jgi:hypothetical protein